jgi:hypothetical protein
MCIYYAFYLLAPAVPVLFPGVGCSLLCDGRLNVCRVLVSYLYCLVVAWVGVVEWEDVGEVCTIIFLNTGHTYGTITDTMEIMKTERKGRYLNTLERYYIYEIGKDNLHMNDTNIDIHNPIFKALHRIYTK